MMTCMASSSSDTRSRCCDSASRYRYPARSKYRAKSDRIDRRYVIAGLAMLAIWTLYRIQFHDVQRAHVEPFVGVRNTSHEIVEMVTEDGPAESASRKAS